jgi:hypothetical protein
MFTRSRSIISAILLLLPVLVCGDSAFAAGTNAASLTLTVPRRRRVIKLARDLARLRDMKVVCYQSKIDAKTPTIHLFKDGKWKQTDLKHYDAMVSGRLVVIGDSKTVPTVLLADKYQAATTWRVETLDVATIVTNLADKLDLNSREVKWLAGRHGLKISETKAPRRKYGRPDGSTKKKKAKKKSKKKESAKTDDDLPPPGSYPSKPTLEEIDDEPEFEKGMEDTESTSTGKTEVDSSDSDAAKEE